MKRRLRIIWASALLVILGIGLTSSLTSCSPGFVIRAGWEEAGILLRRKPIEKIAQNPNTDEETKRKLELVLSARDFAEKNGLNAKGNFKTYSKIDRDVLVWVLSAAEKTSFTPYTWWFPIVGSVPYKGFFDKEDGIKALNHLKAKDYDAFLRPSPAFSTLGWFDDPLLSTTLAADEISLADTVIHEILHSTVWIKNSVPFNETLANFFGSQGAYELFLELDGPDSLRAKQVKERWADEMIFARFLESTVKELSEIYKLHESGTAREEILKLREEAYASARTKWQSQLDLLQTTNYIKAADNLNNAVIIANQIYLDRPWLFEQFFEHSGASLPLFLKEIKKLAKTAERSKRDPYEILSELLETTRPMPETAEAHPAS